MTSIDDFSNISMRQSYMEAPPPQLPKNMKMDPNAAPLDQHIKNLQCQGISYQVVKEAPEFYRYQLGISPSRKAFNRELAKETGLAKKGRKGKKKVDEDSCFALNAAQNAAIEEIMAEERDIRKAQADEEFHTKIKNAVHRREKQARMMRKAKATQHADRLKDVIVQTVRNFYMDKKAKNRRDESNILSDDSRDGLSPIRDLVDKKGPMGGKKGKNLSGNADLNVTNVDTTTPANIMERYFGEEIDLGNA